MRNLYLTLALILTSNFLFGQTRSKLLVTYGISNAKPVYNKNVDGGGSTAGKSSFSFGLQYLQKSRTPVAFETGIIFSRHKYAKSPAFYPGIDMTPTNENLELITIPVFANLTFLKYFFINAGALADFEINKNNTVQKQSGIGLGGGLGIKYDFDHVHVMLNPFAQRHAWIPFEKTGTRQSLLEAGIKVGVGYSF